MGIYATYYAIPKAQIEEVKKDNDIGFDSEKLFSDISCDLGKMWDILHYLLTNQNSYDIVLNNDSDNVFHQAIYGVECLNQNEVILNENAEPLIYIKVDDVLRIADKLSTIDTSVLFQNFDTNNFLKNNIYPEIWEDINISEIAEIRLEAVSCFNKLKDFYRQTAEDSKLVTVCMG